MQSLYLQLDGEPEGIRRMLHFGFERLPVQLGRPDHDRAAEYQQRQRDGSRVENKISL
jgi:hypothetical protein